MEVKTEERIKMLVRLDVTESQGLALEAMFEYWNYLAGIGSSRQISFMVDGDGNFKPNCKMSYDRTMPKLTDKIRELAVVEEKNRARKYDFNPIAWYLRDNKVLT